MPRLMMSSLRALLVLFLLSGCAAPRQTTQPPAEARLVSLMEQRLAIAHEVAWIKYSNALPVLDAKREAEVLARLTGLGTARGLPPETIHAFYTAQIAASRAQQEADIRLWKAGAPLPVTAPQSLKDDIRPKIDTVDRQIIATLASATTRGRALSDYAYESLRRQGFSVKAARLSSGALR